MFKNGTNVFAYKESKRIYKAIKMNITLRNMSFEI